MKTSMSDFATVDSSTDEVPGSLLRLVADSVPALIAYYEVGTLRCRFANRRYAEYNGWTPRTILGKTVREAVGEQAWSVIEPHVRTVIGGQEVRYIREQTLPDGGQRIIEVSLIPHFADAGTLMGAFVLINDITTAWHAERTIRESEERMRKFMEASSEGILFHRDGVITDVNEALVELVGHPAHALIGRRAIDLVPEEWQATVSEHIESQRDESYEITITHADGRRIPVEIVAKMLHYGGEEQRMVVVRDITARKQAQERIEFLALHDALTELPNRLYLNDYLPRTLALARRQNKRVAVIFIDLDGFKPVNDTLGHDAGDAMLCAVAHRLRGTVRESDLVARLGGDEFLIVLTDVAAPSDVERVAGALLENMRTPVVWRGKTLTPSMSVGVSLSPDHGISGDELIRRADSAMYRAKTDGGNRYSLFSGAADH